MRQPDRTTPSPAFRAFKRHIGLTAFQRHIPDMSLEKKPAPRRWMWLLLLRARAAAPEELGDARAVGRGRAGHPQTVPTASRRETCAKSSQEGGSGPVGWATVTERAAPRSKPGRASAVRAIWPTRSTWEQRPRARGAARSTLLQPRGSAQGATSSVARPARASEPCYRCTFKRRRSVDVHHAARVSRKNHPSIHPKNPTMHPGLR